MKEFVALIVVGALAAYLVIAIASAPVRNLAVEPAPYGAAVVPATPDFNETGTLAFYPNNAGPVPYLYYQDPSGHTRVKALIFAGKPPDALFSWAGVRVSVTGRLEHEHVVVINIVYLSAP